MRVYLAIFMCFIFSCAPMLCKMDESVAVNYSEDKAPSNYVSFMSISYGAIRLPFRLEKDGNRYKLQGSNIPGVSFDKRAFCFNSSCFDLPFGPDGIIFGAMLTGEEKASCSSGGIILSRDAGNYNIKHYFIDKNLSKVEILDKKREKLITLNYVLKSKDGYYKKVKVSTDDFSFTINIEEVSF